MTQSPKNSSGERSRSKISSPFYPLTWEKAVRDYAEGLITPRGLICYYFEVNLRPGKELVIDVEEFCEMLQISRATYYRVIGALQELNRINIRRGKMIISRVDSFPQAESRTGQGLSQLCDSLSQSCDDLSQSCDDLSQSCDSLSQESESEFSEENLKSLSRQKIQGADSKEGNVPNRSINLKNNRTVPTRHPVLVPEEMNRKGIGTSLVSAERTKNPELAQLAKLSELAGVHLNRTILEALEETLDNAGTLTSARRLVENAISALQEQQGKVRNPGGFFVAALKRQFTSNEAKRDARQSNSPDLNQVSASIDQALLRGDRAWAVGKLQALWNEGWKEEVEELCLLRRDWAIQMEGS